LHLPRHSIFPISLKSIPTFPGRKNNDVNKLRKKACQAAKLHGQVLRRACALRPSPSGEEHNDGQELFAQSDDALYLMAM
jgi:hypothetical protein